MRKWLMLGLLGLVLVALLVLIPGARGAENSVDVYQDGNKCRIECIAAEPLAAISVLLRFADAKVSGFEPGADLKDTLWVKLEDNYEFTIATFPLREEYGSGKIRLGTVETTAPSRADTFTNLVGSCLAFCTPDCRVIKPQFQFHEQSSVTGDESRSSVPKEFSLGVYPNPFNPVIDVDFSVPVRQKVDIYVCNILGQRVITLWSNESEGQKTIQWSPQEVSGTFFVIMKCPKYRRVEKITLLK